jgi:hypothetical protein
MKRISTCFWHIFVVVEELMLHKSSLCLGTRILEVCAQEKFLPKWIVSSQNLGTLETNLKAGTE